MKLLNYKNIIARKQQAGMTLTEALLVLTIGALVAVLAYGGYRMATNDVKTQSQVNGIITLSGKIKQVFSTGADYSTVTAANVINAGLVPPDFRAAGGTINNSWGGTVTPTAVAGNAARYQIVITVVPVDGCMDFLAGISNSGLILDLDGVSAKAIGGQFTPSTALATACALATGGRTATLVNQ